jgi:hypothetical protein
MPTNVRYKTVRSDGYVVNQGSLKIPGERTVNKSIDIPDTAPPQKSINLPFTVLPTNNVKITKKTGDISPYITITDAPSDSNGFKTTVKFLDYNALGNQSVKAQGLHSCTLELIQTNTTTTGALEGYINIANTDASMITPSDGNVPINLMQPYMTMNHIIKY